MPATVGVLDGALRVGLSDSELERFTPTRARSARATSQPRHPGRGRGDDGRRHARRLPAAGIGFLGTGGIGGVHRGNRIDISADLAELARTQALVVSSGIKSLLDVPATMELLESLGSPSWGCRRMTCRSSTPRTEAHRYRHESRAPARRPSSRAPTGASSATRAATRPAAAESIDDVEPLIDEALEQPTSRASRGRR